MSTFFSKLAEIRTDESGSRPHNNIHATPTPVDIGATYGLLIDSYYQIQSEASGPEHAERLQSMISELESGIANPPKEVQGVSQTFLDSLDRVSKKSLKKTDECPICSEKFLDDPHPLVVELPCHPGHRFDMDCIAPWLKLKGSCPLDRKDLTKKKQIVIIDDDEEDYDDMIA
jgi:hypothetical protein